MDDFFPLPAKCRKELDKNIIEVLARFTESCKTDKPDDIIIYAIDYFKKLRQKRQDDKAEKEYIDKLSLKQAVTPLAEFDTEEEFIEGHHEHVRSECHDLEKLKQELPNRPVEKRMETKKFLASTLRQSCLFQTLDYERMRNVINAMRPKFVRKGECVLEQGKTIDSFMVFENGAFEVLKIKPPVPEPKLIRTGGRGEYFGENSLLHPIVNKVSVIALLDSTLWTISRVRFRRILLRTGLSQRRKNAKFLNYIPFFENLTESERLSIAEQMRTVYIKEGESVYQQGECASGIFVVEYGSVSLNLRGSQDLQIMVNRVEERQYFGEMALFTHDRRPSTAIALIPLCLHFVGVSSFENVVGPCLQLMARTPVGLSERIMELFGHISNIKNLRSELPNTLRLSLESLRDLEVENKTSHEEMQ